MNISRLVEANAERDRERERESMQALECKVKAGESFECPLGHHSVCEIFFHTLWRCCSVPSHSKSGRQQNAPAVGRMAVAVSHRRCGHRPRHTCPMARDQSSCTVDPTRLVECGLVFSICCFQRSLSGLCSPFPSDKPSKASASEVKQIDSSERTQSSNRC